MLDLVRLYLKAGDGGNGRVSFFRNRRVLKGGPDGGNGGDGGDIWLEVDDKLNTLQHFSGVKRFTADSGVLGGRANQIGKKGENITLKVPTGTVVWLIDENKTSQTRRERYGLAKKLSRDEADLTKYYLEKEGSAAPVRELDDIDAQARPNFNAYRRAQEEGEAAVYQPIPDGKIVRLAQLNTSQEKLLLAQGGYGGRGNTAFKGPAKTTPLEAEYGSFGEQKLIFLELRLLANVGLVGLPNAGKSSLLARLTQAKPKIANYPFTTLEPNLGVLRLDGERSLVLADIPGLVEGASRGKGLGFTFLRHVQNSKILVFVLSLAEEEVFSTNLTNQEKADLLWQQYQQVRQELIDYNDELNQKTTVIAISKSDLYDQELRQEIEKRFQTVKPIYFISSAAGEGLAEFTQVLWQKFSQK
ncbi:MAG: 50S ribosome-binding GTPase [bacterium]|nr:50S ribosome-binding GTPase [bacterium]